MVDGPDRDPGRRDGRARARDLGRGRRDGGRVHRAPSRDLGAPGRARRRRAAGSGPARGGARGGMSARLLACLALALFGATAAAQERAPTPTGVPALTEPPAPTAAP